MEGLCDSDGCSARRSAMLSILRYLGRGSVEDDRLRSGCTNLSPHNLARIESVVIAG